MTADSSPADGTAAPEAEFRHGAISFLDALVIGLASTSPAYSLAVIVGPVVALVGVYAPGVVLASFVPMLLIASAFYYPNKADQDCDTAFWRPARRGRPSRSSTRRSPCPPSPPRRPPGCAPSCSSSTSTPPR
jgi:hypothetical protein